MAERTGLEPATSCVTGRRSNQLNYRSVSNGLSEKSDLTILPHVPVFWEIYISLTGGRDRARTCDPHLVRVMLSQLSYPPGQTLNQTGI